MQQNNPRRPGGANNERDAAEIDRRREDKRRAVADAMARLRREREEQGVAPADRTKGTAA